MPQANLNGPAVQVDDGMQSIVVVKDLGDVPGGRALDVSGLDSDTKIVRAGHILVKDTSTGAYSPLGVTTNDDGDEVYKSLPSGKTYAGVLKSSILVSDPRAAILTVGQVNAAASPYPVTDAIIGGLPQIQFLYV
ncbi:MAG: hypothetical protein LUC24_04610 [Bacteroidales bacterium]|nr:hypothetical protein [Bacteroidales bacterium]